MRSPPQVAESVRNAVARRGLACALGVAANGPVPAQLVRLLDGTGGSRNVLSDWFLSKPPARKQPAELDTRRLLPAQDNSFAIGTAALSFLDATVQRLRPSAVLEFGSGDSTVALAAAMARLHGGEGPVHVFSIDESAEYTETTRLLLQRAGLATRVRVAQRPLRDQTVFGVPCRCYDLSPQFLDEFLTAVPGLVLVDGPSGGNNVRFGTLPLVQERLARPCSFLLDDAFRSNEIALASQWHTRRWVHLRGVHPFGHGILEGSLV